MTAVNGYTFQTFDTDLYWDSSESIIPPLINDC